MARKKKKKYRGFWRFVRIQFVLILLVVAAVMYYNFGGYADKVTAMKEEADSLVKQSSAETFRGSETSVVYDNKGEEITTLKGEKDSYYIDFAEIPVNCTAAIISIEDKKFYRHQGVDYRAIMRAVKAAIENGEITQGASTITQQLARTIFLNNEQSWQRKVEEIFIAQNLEKKYSKEQILEFYLNNIYFGNGYYGIQAASLGYFSKTVDELDLSQIAYLCAIPNNPTLYDPLTKNEQTLQRRNRILKNMYQDNKITKGAYELASTETITLHTSTREKNNYVETYIYYCATRALMEADGFQFLYEFESDAARQQYDESYSAEYSKCNQELFTEGYRIYTSIDLAMQKELQQAVDQGLADFTSLSPEGIYELQAAGVCIDNGTGYVSAIVGGRSQDMEGYTLNRAYQSFRQPGSAIKPLLVYTPALERGYTPESIVIDEKTEDGPSNANGSYSGEISLRTAVASSKNTVAYKLLEEMSPKTGFSYLRNMNFSKLSETDLKPLAALGGFTNGTSPVEMTAGYAAIENDGAFRSPTCIRQITNAAGTVVVENAQKTTQVYRTSAARMMTNMMETVIEEGTGRGLEIENMPTAGKTGTTNDNKDGWFVGYSSYYTTGVWVGYDMPKTLPGLTGSSYPGEIWQNFMNQIHTGLESAEFLPYIKDMGIQSDVKTDGTREDNTTMDENN